MQTNLAFQDAPLDDADTRPEPAHFCDSALKDLRRHDLRTGSKLYQYALQIYIADSGPLLNRIATGIETSSFSQVRQAAHTLKSNSLLVGALRVGRLAATIESHATQESGLASEMAAELETLLESANHEILKRLRSPPR
jgi:HPt (histidine-containing phosphotransfer) domain-containing protein